ncbi:unnamed protein product [Fusarium equiseti]|uniref:Glycosyl transferase n=1 Tax=Fusarium equiseti TaxID=61235 RepID=A0A8J2NCQ1_FUSEQ|nr:unnamed protein product [Fusarium equiseti]
MIRKSTLFRVFHRPSRPIRILALSLFFFTASWTVLTVSPLLCPRQADLETDYPLIHRHIYSCNSTGGGKCPIHGNAIGEPHDPNREISMNILDAARQVSQSALSWKERRLPFSNIPLIVHQTWKTTAADSWNSKILPWVELWLGAAIKAESGPAMAYLFWDDAGMRSLIEEYEKDFLETYDSILTPVERSDAFRILVCKHFGGIYGDLDTELIRHPATWISPSDISTWTDTEAHIEYGYYNHSVMLDDQTSVVNFLWGLEADNDPGSDAYWRQSYTYPQQLSQWAFAAAPHHPIVTQYMENLRGYTKDNETAALNSDPLKRTGPAAVTLATKSLLEDRVGFRWASLTGFKDGGRPKLVDDVLILPITAFQ